MIVKDASRSRVALVAALALGGGGACDKKSGDPLPKPGASSAASGAGATAASSPKPSASPSARQPGGDTNVGLIHARSATPTTKGLSMIAITPKEIRLVGTKNEPIPMPAPVSWYAGLPISVKGGQPGMLIYPIADWLRQIRKEKGAQAGRDLSLVVDNAITYKIVTEVLYTAAVNGFDRFHLVALTPDEAYAEMILEMPGFKPDAGVAPPFVSILVAQEGISIKTETNNVGPGCAKFGVGLAYSRVNGEVDTIGIPSCMDRITPEDAGASAEDIVVGANPEIPFGEVAAVIDGVRGRKMKTVVHLGTQRAPPPGGGVVPPPTIPAIPGLSPTR